MAEQTNLTTAIDTRRGTDAQIWVVGCSIAHGHGVTEQEKFGTLIAQALRLPASWLTARGSSIPWAGHQILKSDLQRGDIIVWGLTSKDRFVFYTPSGTNHVNPSWFLWCNGNVEQAERTVGHCRMPDCDINDVYVNRMLHIDCEMQSVSMIYSVKNFCDKIGVRLILADLFSANLQSYFAQDPDYIPLQSSRIKQQPGLNYLDIAQDGLHPGPLTHKLYADQILDTLAMDVKIQ